MTERTKKEVNLIYKHTHRDFKSNTDKVKKVMYLCPETGCTTLGPVLSLPECVWSEKLERALNRESKGM